MMKLKNKNEKLEVLRGLACIIVFVSHFRVATHYFKSPSFDWIQLFTAWGKEAVIIFFMLSGIVINISTTHKRDVFNYFKKRIIRILPIYWLAIFISLFIIIFYDKTTVNLNNLIGNILFLGTEQGFIVGTIPYNQAVWSISCEMFFYAIFGLIVSQRNRTRYMWIWLITSIVVIFISASIDNFINGLVGHILFMLKMSLIWILGYLVYQYRHFFHVKLPTAMLSLSLIPLAGRIHTGFFVDFKYQLLALYLIPFFAFLLQQRKESSYKVTEIKYSYIFLLYILALLIFIAYSKSTYTNLILYSSMPIFTLLSFSDLSVKVIRFIYHKIKTPLVYIGSISYAIYLFHVPVMYFFSGVISHMYLGLAIITVVVVILSYIAEKIVQPRINILFTKTVSN